MKHSHSLSDYFVKHVDSDTQPNLSSFLEEMCSTFGLSHATYFGSNLPGENTGEDLLITTYDKNWIKHYFNHEYQYIDPILSAGSQSLLPVDWSILPVSNPIQKTFFGEASEFGVGKFGLTVPIRGLHGDSALFSINASVSEREWQSYRNEVISDLTYFAFLFHDRVLKERTNQVVETFTTLTSREQEVLRWAAKGKTAWETSRILGVAEKTVSFYIGNACAKLGAASKTQAVANVVSKRLFLI